MQQLTAQLEDHINCSYSSYDRVLLPGYPPGVFVEGSVIRLLRNLGFTCHSNGVMRTLTDQLNDHISTIALPLDSEIRWWSEAEKRKYHSGIDFVEAHYRAALSQPLGKSIAVCIVKAVETVRTFAIKEVAAEVGRSLQGCIHATNL